MGAVDVVVVGELDMDEVPPVTLHLSFWWGFGFKAAAIDKAARQTPIRAERKAMAASTDMNSMRLTFIRPHLPVLRRYSLRQLGLVVHLPFRHGAVILRGLLFGCRVEAAEGTCPSKELHEGGRCALNRQ